MAVHTYGTTNIAFSSFDTWYLSRDFKFDCQNDFVLLKGRSDTIVKYDIENNIFINIDREEIDYNLFKKK